MNRSYLTNVEVELVDKTKPRFPAVRIVYLPHHEDPQSVRFETILMSPITIPYHSINYIYPNAA